MNSVLARLAKEMIFPFMWQATHTNYFVDLPNPGLSILQHANPLNSGSFFLVRHYYSSQTGIFLIISISSVDYNTSMLSHRQTTSPIHHQMMSPFPYTPGARCCNIAALPARPLRLEYPKIRWQPENCAN